VTPLRTTFDHFWVVFDHFWVVPQDHVQQEQFAEAADIQRQIQASERGLVQPPLTTCSPYPIPPTPYTIHPKPLTNANAGSRRRNEAWCNPQTINPSPCNLNCQQSTVSP